jgi:4-amino-4-deoxy-L-arabinose transferase-like glycosyltransferase
MTKKLSLLLILGIYLLLTLPFLSSSPLIWFDEGLLSETGWHLANKGTFIQPLRTGYLGYEEFSTHPNYLFFIALAASFKFLGLGIIQARLVSVISGFLLLIFMYVIIKKIINEKTALCAMLLLACNPLFILSARMVRQEMMITFFGFLAIGLAILSYKQKNTYAFFAGFFAACAVLVHLNGLFIILAVLGIYTIKKQWKEIGYFVIGGVILSIPYAIFIFIHWEVFITQFFGQWAYRLPSEGSNILFNIVHEPLRWVKGITAPLSIIIGVVSAVLLLPNIKKFREWYVSLGILILCFTCVDYHKYYGYLLLLLPYFCILSAIVLTKLFQKKKAISILVLVCILITYIGIIEYKIWRDHDADYDEYCASIQKEINTTRIILADARLWFCFPNGNLREIMSPLWIQEYSGKSFNDIFKEEKITYIIIDPITYDIIHSKGIFFSIPGEYAPFIESCKKIGEVFNEYYTPSNSNNQNTIIYMCE